MLAKPETFEKLTRSMQYVQKLPYGTYFAFSYDGSIMIEASTLEEVKACRSCFGRRVWTKEYKEFAKYWVYKTKTKDNVTVIINGVTEAPRACRAVTEVVKEKRSVPVGGYREEEVEVMRTRYICPGDSKKEV